LRRVSRHCLLLASICILSASAARADFAEVGHPPPLFSLVDEVGELHRLQDLLGKPIVLYFTHNMCHYCTQVIAFLKRAHAAREGTDFTIITVNVWAKGSKLIRRYKEQFGLPFRMLAGKNKELLRNYEVNYVPIVIFIGRDGLIKRIYHHYILQHDFDASVQQIMEGE
jgi:peroxiredoxin